MAITITIGELYSVLKLRIGVAIAATAVAGLYASPGAPVPFWKAAVLGFSVLAASAAAGAFNQYVERDLDARMARTRTRPFVTGRFQAGWPWLLGIGALLVAGVAVAGLALGPVPALHIFLGAFVYGVVYTVWLKRRSVLNIVIGGLAGSFAVLAGAAVVDPVPGPVALLLALTLFLWTPPHFWSLAAMLREDYAAAGVPMLPVVMSEAAAARVILMHTAALVAVSLLPAYFGLGLVYLACALAGGAVFLGYSVAYALGPSRVAARRNFLASLLQLALLLVGAVAGGLL